MSPDEVTLLAYVDGELPAHSRSEVEAAIAANAELARTVRAMQVSRLPYQSAYEQQPTPAVPAGLRAQVEELASVALASREVASRQFASGELAAREMAVAGGTPAGRGSKGSWSRAAGWFAAMLVTLAIGWLAGYLGGQRAQAAPVEPWVRMVSSYHSMYSRDTVLDGGVATAQVAALKARLAYQQGLNLKIPDLEADGLSFVRAQQLQFNGKMVLQLVYLPKQGLPIALCLIPSGQQAERSLTIDGQQAVTWRTGDWGYLLIGQKPLPELERLRSKITAVVV
jgi:anti-sigma factor RsiW